MSSEGSKAAAVRYWWDKAHESLQAAHRELAADAYTFAINRVYYALFYAVSALLLEEGRRFSKHSGVRAAFNRDLVKPGRLSRKHGELYNQLFRNRQEGDYIEFTVFGAPYVQEKIVACEEFLWLFDHYSPRCHMRHEAWSVPPDPVQTTCVYEPTCASAASAWGSQKVISIARYSSIAVDSTVRACCRCPVLTYSVPRLRWQCAWSGAYPALRPERGPGGSELWPVQPPEARAAPQCRRGGGGHTPGCPVPGGRGRVPGRARRGHAPPPGGRPADAPHSGETTERLKTTHVHCHGLFHCLCEQRHGLGNAPAQDICRTQGPGRPREKEREGRVLTEAYSLFGAGRGLSRGRLGGGSADRSNEANIRLAG